MNSKMHFRCGGLLADAMSSGVRASPRRTDTVLGGWEVVQGHQRGKPEARRGHALFMNLCERTLQGERDGRVAGSCHFTAHIAAADGTHYRH